MHENMQKRKFVRLGDLVELVQVVNLAELTEFKGSLRPVGLRVVGPFG